MQPTHPNDYLWQEITALQHDVYHTFDPALQMLTLYLEVWLAVAAVFIVLALVIGYFQTRQDQSAQTVTTTVAEPDETGRPSLASTSFPSLSFPSLQVQS